MADAWGHAPPGKPQVPSDREPVPGVQGPSQCRVLSQCVTATLQALHSGWQDKRSGARFSTKEEYEAAVTFEITTSRSVTRLSAVRLSAGGTNRGARGWCTGRRTMSLKSAPE